MKQFHRAALFGHVRAYSRRAYSLCENCCNRRSCRAHLEHRYHQQVAADVQNAGDCHGYQRNFGVDDTSENAADIFFDAAIAMACPPMTIIFDFCPKSDSTIIIISRRIVNTFFEKTLRGRNISDKQGNDGRKTCD